MNFDKNVLHDLTDTSVISAESSNHIPVSLQGKKEKLLTIVIPMYREIAEVKSALRGCLDFKSYGYAEDVSINIIVIIDGCTASNDRTLQSLKLEICNNGGDFNDPLCNETFGCLVYSTMFACIPIQVLVKGSNVQKGKRYSQIMAFDYLSQSRFLPDVVIFQDCDTYMPACEMYTALKRALENQKITSPQILVYSNVFYDGLLALFPRGVLEILFRYHRNTFQRIGCCPLLPGPIAVYPYEHLKKIMALYSKDYPIEEDMDVFHGNKMLVEDAFMGWCATAAGVVPDLEFNRCCGYWNLPGRLFPLLRQRRRWKAGQISTAVVGHPELGIALWKTILMRYVDIFMNVFCSFGINILVSYLMMSQAVNYFGEWIILIIISPMLRTLLSPYISAKNDSWFMIWICVDSLWVWLVSPWTFQDFDFRLLWPWLFIAPVLGLLAMKCGTGTAISAICGMLVEMLLFELQLFELDYTCYMFDDVVWGNREVKSKLPPSKLDIMCISDPQEKSWAKSSPLAKYKKTCRSVFIKMVPFVFRMIVGILLWFKVFTFNIAMIALLTLAFLQTYSFAYVELLVAPKTRQHRSYKPCSSLKLPGPILQDVDLKKCHKV